MLANVHNNVPLLYKIQSILQQLETVVSEFRLVITAQAREDAIPTHLLHHSVVAMVDKARVSLLFKKYAI